MKRIDIFFDGACHNKVNESSPMGMGIAVYLDGEYESDVSLAIYNDGTEERGTNNIAEWLACVDAMRTASELRKMFPYAEFFIYSDSLIIANQFNGTYQIRDERFRPHLNKAREWAAKARVTIVTWIPREKNKQADELSKRGLHGSNPDSKHYNKYKFV